MKAIAYTAYGGPEVTALLELPHPAPGPGQVLVWVAGGGLNPVDAAQRAGAFRQIRPYSFPQIAGNELSGTVAALGSGVTGLAVGDAVFARVDKALLGAFASSVAIDASLVALAPRSLDLMDAAGVPLAALTAWQALGSERLDIGPGDRLLVTGAAGGVGLIAIQLAKRAGAYVTVTASAAGEPLVRRLGADDVIDYRHRSVSSGGERFDKVFDLVGGEALEDLVASVRPGGCIVSVAGPLTPGSLDAELSGVKQWFVPLVLRLRSRAIRRRARAAGVSYQYFFMRPDGGQLAELATLIDQGGLEVVIDSRFPADHFAEAFARLESRRAKGKIVLDFTGMG